MERVNLMVGRFQPFTLGHLKCVETAWKENGYPTIICMISNTKFDARHPFSDELIEEEMKDICKGNKMVHSIRRVTNGNIAGIVHFINMDNIEVQAIVTGTDRVEDYEKIVDRARKNPNQDRNPFIDSFHVIEVKRGDEDVSATKVRQTIKDDNLSEFKKLMPSSAVKLFDRFKEQLNSVKESFISLTNYIVDKL